MAVSYTGQAASTWTTASAINTGALAPSGSEGVIGAGILWDGSATITSVKHGSGGPDFSAVSGASADYTTGVSLHGRGYVRAVGSGTAGVWVIWSGAVTGLISAIIQDGANQTTPAVSGFGSSGHFNPTAGSSPSSLTLSNSSISCAVGDMVNNFAMFQCNNVVSMSGISSTTGTEVNQVGSGFRMGAGYYDTCDSTSESANATGTCPAFYYSGYGSYSPFMNGVHVGFVVQQSGGGGPSPINEPVGPNALKLTGYAPESTRKGGYTSESVPSSSLKLTGYAPETLIRGGFIQEPVGPSSLKLTGYAPEFVIKGGSISEPIDAAVLRLTAYAPEYTVKGGYASEPIPPAAITLTAYNPEFTRRAGYTSEAIPQTAIRITGYAPEFSLSTGNIREPVPQASLTLTGYAPEFTLFTPRIGIAIPPGSLRLTSYTPDFTVPHPIAIAVPSNVIRLTSYAPGFNIPREAIETRTAGGGPPKRKVVVIGNRRYEVENNAHLSALLNAYLMERREQLAQIEALPEPRKKKRYQVLRTQIAVTEKRIQKLNDDEDEELLMMMVA